MVSIYSYPPGLYHSIAKWLTEHLISHLIAQNCIFAYVFSAEETLPESVQLEWSYSLFKMKQCYSVFWSLSLFPLTLHRKNASLSPLFFSCFYSYIILNTCYVLGSKTEETPACHGCLKYFEECRCSTNDYMCVSLRKWKISSTAFLKKKKKKDSQKQWPCILMWDKSSQSWW